MDVVVKNTSSFIGKGRWQWTLYVDAKQDVLEKIKCVEYTLHSTYSNPIQVVCERGSNPAQSFALPGDGWGEFDVGVKVTFADRPPQSYVHRLTLAQPDQPQPLCQVAETLSLQEEQVRGLAGPFKNVYLLADAIHKSRPSRLIIMHTRQAIDPAHFNWDRTKHALKESKTGVLEEGGRRVITPKERELVKVPLTENTVLSLYIGHTGSHSTIDVNICQ